MLPRNGISVLHTAVNDIHSFAIKHGMKVNPKKCEEMLINFMHHHKFSFRAITIGNTKVECVSSYKLLGVTISDDLKWGPHIDNIIKKASKHLYALRILKKVNVPSTAILKVYLTTVRPTLEYLVQVWQNLPQVCPRSLRRYRNGQCTSYILGLAIKTPLRPWWTGFLSECIYVNNIHEVRRLKPTISKILMEMSPKIFGHALIIARDLYRVARTFCTFLK